MNPVVVVGAGLAGTVAAIRLHSGGLPVVLVADRPGATVMHSGGWLLGREALRAQLPGADADLDAAVDFVQAGLPGLNLTEGSLELLDAEGALRPCDLAPANHAAMETLRGRLAAADLTPVGHPFAFMQSRAEAVAVDWPPYPDAFGRSFAALAHRAEADPQEPAALLAALKRALEGRGYAGLILPPVLGLRRAAEMRSRLEAGLGLPVVEALGVQPSTPGLRLNTALEDWVRSAGLTCRRARVEALSLDPLGVRIGGETLAARAVILATGRYITGGLTSHPDVREPLADLPLAPAVPSNPLWGLSPRGPYDGRVFEAGVRTDARFRVIGPDATPLHPGLFAIGDLSGGLDPLSQACASGRCLLGAWRAAGALLEAA